MIREKMFRLHRHKSFSTNKSGERINFVFSNIQALQVPKGWDRLYVCLLSTETGKTVNKSGKAYVRNGTCQWTETLSESIFISQDETPKEFQQYLYKLVVGMGSARSSILGEANVNLAGYMGSRASIPVSLPLKNCNHGTTLQVEIQCLTPRIKQGDAKWNHTNSYAEDANSDCDDVDNKSEVSLGGSSSSNHLDGTSHAEDLGSRETSFSASGPRYSFDSIEGSLGRESMSPQNSISGIIKHAVGRQDSGSGRHPQREEFGQISHGSMASPLQNSGSSANYMESEVTAMEEHRAEARMWERNARKLMLDHDLLMKEFLDQSKQLASLEVELSASRRECDGLQQETEHLKVLLEKSMDKQKTIDNFKFQPTDAGDVQKVLEDEIKFQKESNHDLSLQLKKTQESNLELVSILQEMEETIESQNKEIEKLKSKVDRAGSFGQEGNGEANSTERFSAEKMRKASCDSDLEGCTKEHPIIDLHAEFGQEDNRSLDLQHLRESQKNLESTILSLKKALEGKNLEIVTEQNLRTQTLRDCEDEWRCKLTAKEEELFHLEEKLSKALIDRDSEVADFESRGHLCLIKEIEALKEKVKELERDCNELTDENLELLLKLKEATEMTPTKSIYSEDSPNSCPSHRSPIASEIEVSEFKYQMCQFDEEIKKEEIPNQGVATKFLNSESQTAIDKFNLLPALFEQLQLLLANVKKQQQSPYSPLASNCRSAVENSHRLRCTDLTTQNAIEKAALDNLVHLNNLFGATSAVELQNKLEADNLEDNTICSQGINCLNKELESRIADLRKQLEGKNSEIEKLNVNHLLKEEEIGDSRRRQRDLETHISDLQKIIEQKEENIEVLQSQSSLTSKCLDSLKNDMIGQSSSLESYISNNTILERKSLELESTKCDLELQISELEEENVLLSGRISGLEAQLRYLTDTGEASRLNLQHSESHVKNLKDDIGRLEYEVEAQKACMKRKTEDMQKRWLEAQEECEHLKKANPKLQATAESLIEECSSLQKSNRELRQQKIELQEHCTVLEVDLKELQSRFCECSKEIESLEAKFSAIVEELYLKERSFNSELDAIYQQNKEYEKIVHTEGFINEISSDTSAEVQHFQDFHGNFKSSQNMVEIIQVDSETNILALTTELVASKENHETLVINHEKLLGQLEDVRSNEEKLKGIIDKLESELKSSEQERLQLAEEISSLETQLQKVPTLQDEVLSLKGSLNGTNFENERLKTSLDLLSGDFEELKTDRINLVQKISSMQKATLELDSCRRSKVALEEKILRLEGDLTASLALCSQDAELKNELSRIKRVNSQFQWKIKQLEEEKQEWLQKAKALEQELKQNSEVKQEQVGPNSNPFHVDHGSCGTNDCIDKDCKHAEKSEEANFFQLSKDQSEVLEPSTVIDQIQLLDNRGMVRHQRQENNGQHVNAASSPKIAVDTVSRITHLESELAEALEANHMYKAQLKSSLSGMQVDQSGTHDNLEAENYASNKEEKKQKADLLEAELREIRERYLEMSLRYAEVEAQREQLVMKLKTVNSGTRWFS